MELAETIYSLFDDKKIDVMKIFFADQEDNFTLQDISKASKVPLATTYRIIKQLVELKIISIEQVRHLKLYHFSNSEQAQKLADLLYSKPRPVLRFVELTQNILGVESIILNGKETETKANVVIIGQTVDKEAVLSAVLQVEDELSFKITHLILDPEQYAMLETMGQFQSNKKVLFTK